MKRITSRQNPLVAAFRAVARGDAPGLLLDGTHLVAEALASAAAIRRAMVTSDGLARPEVRTIVERLERAGIEVVSVPPAVLAAVSTVRSPGVIVAVADPPASDPDRIFANVPLVVAACDVQDPGNLGAIVRVVEAAGGTGVIAAGSSADPFSPKALRGSMGSALRLPIQSAAPADAVAAARRRGCRIVAAVPRGGRSVFALDLTGPLTLLVGGEGAGLPSNLVDGADERLTIPMARAVESLNAALTTAVVVYEARRQRQPGTPNVERGTPDMERST